MKICPECGVELDEDMITCPLCDTLVSYNGNRGEKKNTQSRRQSNNEDRKHVMRRILWQITMVLLLSGISATLIINLSIAGKITWAIYPITICVLLLGYVTLMAVWRTRFIFQLSGGWLISTLLLIIIGLYTREDWPLLLALPVVSSVNIIGIFLCLLLAKLKRKGLNVLAIVFVSMAVLCLVVESILSIYFKGSIKLGWSVIVAACLLPVTAAILFMYFKTRHNPELQKIFHT